VDVLGGGVRPNIHCVDFGAELGRSRLPCVFDYLTTQHPKQTHLRYLSCSEQFLPFRFSKLWC
jgi:hypothetical protein